MQTLRANPPEELAGLAVAVREDYLCGERSSGGVQSAIKLPKTDAIKYILSDGSWAAVRPSGTEPKCKFYFSAQGASMAEAENRLCAMMAYFKQF
jgi:phosphoglucomutase